MFVERRGGGTLGGEGSQAGARENSQKLNRLAWLCSGTHRMCFRRRIVSDLIIRATSPPRLKRLGTSQPLFCSRFSHTRYLHADAIRLSYIASWLVCCSNQTYYYYIVHMYYKFCFVKRRTKLTNLTQYIYKNSILIKFITHCSHLL